MKTHDILEWYSTEELHKGSQNWILELEFIKVEHLFFDDMLKSFALQLLDVMEDKDNLKIADALNKSKKRNNTLLKAIKDHDINLKLLVEEMHLSKVETSYKHEHKKLMDELNEYLKTYKTLKTQMFTIMKEVFKKDKQKLLMA